VFSSTNRALLFSSIGDFVGFIFGNKSNVHFRNKVSKYFSSHLPFRRTDLHCTAVAASKLSNEHAWSLTYYWVTGCKTVRLCFCLSACPVCPVCPVCLSVCDVRALWPNGWMDQDETRHAGRPRSRTHCVMVTQLAAAPPPKGHTSNFRHISVVAKWLHGSRCHLVWR